MADTKMDILALYLTTKNYTMGMHTLLKNNRVIHRDKWLHTDYPPPTW